MNLKGNLTSKGLQGSIGKSRMQGILGTNPAAIPITVDNALSLSSTNPVQNRVITAAITNRLWSDEVKTALLQIVEKVAYIDDQGQTYYDALYDALYPPVGLDSISAVFDAGGATIYNTDTLDDLKQYLTVTAYYTSGDSEVVTTYTLSGSMDAGTQTITVSYGGKTTTFTVTVVEWLVSIDAVFTQGSAVIYDTDSLDTLRQYLVVTGTYADSTTATVSDYTLSGTLTAGTSTITVSYGGKTDTFDVTVTTAPVYSLPDNTRTESTYRITTSRYGHVKIEILSAKTTTNNGWGVNLVTGEMGAIGNIGVYQQTITRFTVPAGDMSALCTNFVNNNSIQIGIAIGIVSTSSSATWFGDQTVATGGTYSATKSLAGSKNYSVPFVNVAQKNLSAGSVIEFDLSIYNSTTRFV